MVLNTINSSLGLEKINTGLPFGNTFISSNLKVNRVPVVNSCLGGCGLKISGYKRYACYKCSMRFVIENTDTEIIKLKESPSYILKTEYQPTVITLITQKHFSEVLNSDIDPDFKKSVVSDVLWGEKYLKITTIMRYHITKLILRQSFCLNKSG